MRRHRVQTVVKQVEAVVAISSMRIQLMILFFILGANFSNAQETKSDTSKSYKKRVLESTELEFLSSYYQQSGNNAAVTGGKGNEELTDLTGTIVISVPLNDDDVLTIDAGISAYTSASSSNINPFDNGNNADAFVASSGASKSDSWLSGNLAYNHSSDDRNKVWSAKMSLSTEYDYSSIGFGGSYSRLLNKKNTELSAHGSVYIDSWSLIYPIELRPGGGDNFNIQNFPITGNPDYRPSFSPIDKSGRNSYTIGFGFSQILSKRLQGSIALDLTQQEGLLSTPFQRVYFSDIADSFIDNIHLADDIERLPSSRSKIAIGGRLNYYINEYVVLKTFYRYYSDDWGIKSNTVKIELPVKLGSHFTFYPSYRYYDQTAAAFFALYNEHLSTSEFYTSDFDLSSYSAQNQLGFGISYKDVFTKFHIYKFGLKEVDLRYNSYERSSGLKASIISTSFKFVLD